MWKIERTARATVALAVLLAAASALAGGGQVLPQTAKPKGYSLADLARVTAVYNTDPTVNVPNIPFEILIGDTTVKPGTPLYVPIFYIDDSGGAPAGMPADVSDQAADAAFLDAFLFDAFGVESLIVQVDSKTTVLGDGNVAGTITPPVHDGAPGGTNYIVSPAVLFPLTPGTHTVGIGGTSAATQLCSCHTT